ncbi:hypothetical protein CYLTODRAFT_400721 [Cylindrobasidium torrendii FP15055 ss-10]|uniref:Uncharacterized protein n=1 Tax=Cylindrobasidium torrendii FP15055 ss-10 TaxID=1314674 RepID=A0A0D7B410_9AGAR|nr:hypothetical protein CYLTODRAFT_400721 [Cylindrobasidium torrendii FP15055 ss-10]
MPIASRPPYATDEPDSFYESPQPQRRLRQPAPANPNERSSAYDVYDNYLGNNPHQQQMNRQSGMGELGMGFLNGSMDDDDEDDDDMSKPPLSTDSKQAGPLPSKHAALAAATVGREPSPPPQYIASPRPGYAAPIANLNSLARPEPAQAPQSRQPPPQLNMNQGQNPFIHPSEAYGSGTPMPSTPHPLGAPMTPITPVFARPQKKVDIQFADEKHIMRGDKEEVPLARRGERGDEFWRRFSVVAHTTENRTSSSSWLKKTQNGTTRLSRWVYIIGILLLIAAAGGIGLGWWVSHNDNSHTAPEAMGGSEGQKATGNGATVATGASSALHVAPTHTIDDRDLHVPIPTAPSAMRRAHRRKHFH